MSKAILEPVPSDRRRADPVCLTHPEAVRQLAVHHASVRSHRGELRITAPSPEAYLAANESHPTSTAARPTLARAGTAQAATEQALAVLRDGNEDAAAFRSPAPRADRDPVSALAVATYDGLGERTPPWP